MLQHFEECGVRAGGLSELFHEGLFLEARDNSADPEGMAVDTDGAVQQPEFLGQNRRRTLAMASFRKQLYRRGDWVARNIGAVRPIVDGDVAGVEVGGLELLLVLADIGVDLAHLGHGIHDYLRVPFFVEAVFLCLTSRPLDVLGKRDEIGIREAIGAHDKEALEETPEFVGVHQRPNVGDSFPSATYRNHDFVSGQLEEGRVLGLHNLQLVAQFERLYFRHSLYVAALIFNQGRDISISWLSGDSTVSCVSIVQLHASSSSQHCERAVRSLQTYFAHVSHERALVTEAIAPMVFFTFARLSIRKSPQMCHEVQ